LRSASISTATSPMLNAWLTYSGFEQRNLAKAVSA